MERESKRVLIVENDHDIREIISLILSEQGYQVINYDGHSTVEMQLLSPDLILLDEWINERDGSSLCLEIKKIHGLVHVPVIILSTRPNIEEIARECKADAFIAKPFDVEYLVSQIDKVLVLPGIM